MIHKGFRTAYRAASVVRTLVVASATLAILLVCFSMYQYTQVEPVPPGTGPRTRLPSTPEELAAFGRQSPAETAGVPIGPGGKGAVGPGQNVKLTIYAPEGTKARMEIEVDDWTPRPGTVEEFQLTRPRIRMRTNDGNAVRVTANEGVIEARRERGGSLDPRRGRLAGEVVIEFDRLSEKQRAALPPERRETIDPADVVRVELAEMEFDIEYSKVVVPGELRLTASDVSLAAQSVEIRFNDAENRVESLRIAGGGRFELLPASNSTGTTAPGLDGGGVREVSMADWLRATLRTQLADGSAQTQSQKTEGATQESSDTGSSKGSAPDRIGARPPTGHETPGESKIAESATVVRRADGAYVFRPGKREREATSAPARYHARFEGEVKVSRDTGNEAMSRLEADWLEVLRAVSDQDRTQMRQPAAAAVAPTTGSTTPDSPSTERVVVTWNRRLGVEALGPGDPNWIDAERNRVTAGGDPMRLSHPDGETTCINLTYLPDTSEATLQGGAEKPVVVRSLSRGDLTAKSVIARRSSERFAIDATGPGRIVQHGGASHSDALQGGEKSAPPEASLGGKADGASFIEFGGRMEAVGMGSTIRRPNLAALSIREEQVQILDEAKFSGNVRVRRGDLSFDADEMIVDFGARTTWTGTEQTIERLVGDGNVRMMEGDSRVSCRAMDIRFETDSDGRLKPLVATANGDVEVVEGERSLSARDRLVVEFGTVRTAGAAEKATQGVDRVVQGSEARSPKGDGLGGSGTGSRVFVRRMEAEGDVAVSDTRQLLDLRAETLICGLLENGRIETANLSGTGQRPASVRLDDFTVSGQRVHMNVPDESAEVPGAGRLSFRSRKDLDGREVREPIPIVVTWSEAMKYQGRENRVQFTGAVHATSETTTTFDCDRLLIEFVDAAPRERVAKEADWWLVGPIVERIADASPETDPSDTGLQVNKEPAYLLATGNAVALTADLDPATGEVTSRARLTGPKLSLNLRREVSKLLIEGPGTLLLEDYQGESGKGSPSPASAAVAGRPLGGGLLSNVEDGGPSNTLVVWAQSMWYDFSIDQTRFEGDVELKHFSGTELARVVGLAEKPAPATPQGRSTFLKCEMLTVDFLDRTARPRSPDAQRMGRIRTDALRQFEARGSVVLQDPTEGLNLWADQVIYERPREILMIHGSAARKARIIKQEPGRLPNQLHVERLIYDLATGKFQLLDTRISGQ